MKYILILLLVLLSSSVCYGGDNTVRKLKEYTLSNTDRMTTIVKIICIDGWKFQVTESKGSGSSISTSVSTTQIYKSNDAGRGFPPQPVLCGE